MSELSAPRELLLLAVMTVLAVSSAVGVVYSVHISRVMVSELQSLQRMGDQLQVEWGQLLLEKSTWGAYAKIEKTAQDRLSMYVPSVDEIVVISP